MVENALDYEGLKRYDEKSKSYVDDKISSLNSAKIDKTTVASSSTLGLVKSGTDISVDSNGNVSVNDNSHKHTVSNISDLTASASELNVLDGITATTDELNYVDGVTSNIQTQLNSKAPIASPTLTGTPKAPTASVGTNNTQIATTGFVQTAISNLVDSAPETLNTLNELSAALGDDPNFATTISNRMGVIEGNVDGIVYGRVHAAVSSNKMPIEVEEYDEYAVRKARRAFRHEEKEKDKFQDTSLVSKMKETMEQEGGTSDAEE